MIAESSGTDTPTLWDPMLRLKIQPETPDERRPLVTLGTSGAPPGHQLETERLSNVDAKGVLHVT